MEILAFLCLSFPAWLIGLAILIPRSLRRQVVTYSLISFAIVVGGLILFEVVSWAVGLIHFGQANSLSLPKDYLSRGTTGIILLIVALLAAISPVIVAWIVRRRARDVAPTEPPPSSGPCTQTSRA